MAVWGSPGPKVSQGGTEAQTPKRDLEALDELVKTEAWHAFTVGKQAIRCGLWFKIQGFRVCFLDLEFSVEFWSFRVR